MKIFHLELITRTREKYTVEIQAPTLEHAARAVSTILSGTFVFVGKEGDFIPTAEIRKGRLIDTGQSKPDIIIPQSPSLN